MIQRVKWNNHIVLGDLELDFTKNDGSSYSTIVLAGENGTGKTTILETLSTFLNLGSIEPFKYISYSVGDVSYTITLKCFCYHSFFSGIFFVTYRQKKRP